MIFTEEEDKVAIKVLRENKHYGARLWFTPHNRLSNRLYNRFYNRLYRVNKHPTGCQTGC